jgi:quaternary ammonium compound-resistance protein SugE
MSTTVAWGLLFCASCFEVAWAGTMKLTEGFTRLLPSIINLICMAGSVYLIETAAKTLPVGTAYAVWTGIGAVGAVVIGIIFYKEPVSVFRLLFLFMIIAGIIGLNITSN